MKASRSPGTRLRSPWIRITSFWCYVYGISQVAAAPPAEIWRTEGHQPISTQPTTSSMRPHSETTQVVPASSADPADPPGIHNLDGSNGVWNKGAPITFSGGNVDIDPQGQPGLRLSVTESKYGEKTKTDFVSKVGSTEISIPFEWLETQRQSRIYAVPIVIIVSAILGAVMIVVSLLVILVSRRHHRQKRLERKRRLKLMREARENDNSPRDDSDIESISTTDSSLYTSGSVALSQQSSRRRLSRRGSRQFVVPLHRRIFSFNGKRFMRRWTGHVKLDDEDIDNSDRSSRTALIDTSHRSSSAQESSNPDIEEERPDLPENAPGNISTANTSATSAPEAQENDASSESHSGPPQQDLGADDLRAANEFTPLQPPQPSDWAPPAYSHGQPHSDAAHNAKDLTDVVAMDPVPEEYGPSSHPARDDDHEPKHDADMYGQFIPGMEDEMDAAPQADLPYVSNWEAAQAARQQGMAAHIATDDKGLLESLRKYNRSTARDFREASAPADTQGDVPHAMSRHPPASSLLPEPSQPIPQSKWKEREKARETRSASHLVEPFVPPYSPGKPPSGNAALMETATAPEGDDDDNERTSSHLDEATAPEE